MTSIDLLERLTAWSYRRQRLDRSAPDPMRALRDVVAVYSSHPSAPLSLLCRTHALDAGWIAAAEERREVLRLSGPRGSIHLMPADTAPRIFGAVRMPVEKFRGNLAYAKLTQEEYDALRRRMPELLREPSTPAWAQEAFGAGANLMTALRVMSATEGSVLRLGGSLRTDVLRYVSTEAWLGRPLEEVDPADALAWLAGEYLRAFGPARVKDVAWWIGTSQARAKAALAGLQTVDLGGGLLLRAEDEAAFASTEPLDPDAVALLPKWDAYTMGYAPDGRQRFVDDAHMLLAYSTAKMGAGATSGDGNPLVLRGGRAVAAWSHRFAGDRMTVAVQPFEPGTRLPLDGLFDEIGGLLGASSVTVSAAG